MRYVMTSRENSPGQRRMQVISKQVDGSIGKIRSDEKKIDMKTEGRRKADVKPLTSQSEGSASPRKSSPRCTS